MVIMKIKTNLILSILLTTIIMFIIMMSSLSNGQPSNVCHDGYGYGFNTCNETSISGYVLNSVNKVGLEGWNLQLVGIESKGIITKTINIRETTNSNGFYKFDNLSEGRYTLILKLKSRNLPIGRTVKQINLVTNQKSENNNFTIMTVNDFIAHLKINRRIVPLI